ncbi:MmgE/PrpD family protein [Acidocella sp.]|uniref:MmgE/PrpD family protein n=1 Tax=Acidocella sp. TaxID=50710 RepID=UPI003D0405F9
MNSILPLVTEAELAPLARYLAEWRNDEDPALAARLFASMLDYGTALLAGTGHEAFPAFCAALVRTDESGPAQVAGQGGRYPVEAAAAANAAIAHLWEVDDTHRLSTSHPGITVVPAVMALAQAYPARRGEAGAAVVAGFEAVMRVGSHLGASHYALNHTTATAGCFGAAAAASRYLGLDAAGMLSAFGHAGTQAAGLWQMLDDGTAAAKGFHAAIAVRNGLAAAFMALAGLPGAPRILEGRRGMRAAWHLRDCDPAWLMPGGRPLIHDVTIKGWPTCGQTHTALDCARALAPQAGGAAAIRTVLVELPTQAMQIAGVQAPRNVSEAKFSTSFCIAAAAAGRAPDFLGLTPALVADPALQALAERTQVRADPQFTTRFPAERPARVTIECVDGKRLVEERAFRNGDPEAPWSEAQMIARAHDILHLAKGPVDVDALVAWARSFPEQGASEGLYQALWG